MESNHLIISITVKIFYPFNICSYESFKKSNCQRTKTQFCVYQLTVDGIKNCCMCLSDGASDPCCPDLLRLTRTAHGWYATEARNWDLRENQEHTISNMLYRLQRRENPLVEDTRLELVEACLQSRCSSRCANPPNKMFLQLTVKNQEHQKLKHQDALPTSLRKKSKKQSFI